MIPLPGSECMVGGPLMCMYFEGASCDWYMNVPYKKPAPYSETECDAVRHAIGVMTTDPMADHVFLSGGHIGHPLPGVYTVTTCRHRVDLRRYHGVHLWAALYVI